MKKSLSLISILALLTALLGACAATAEELTGTAQGYGGPLTVMVTTDGARIADVRVTAHSETGGVGTLAIDALPARMVAENRTDVDGVSGATVTSNAIREAAAQALAQSADWPGAPSAVPGHRTDADFPEGVRSGVGLCATGRIGPGRDVDGGQIYSINIVSAGAVFDGDGRILSLALDQLEAVTPNDDDPNVPRFSGLPGQGGFAEYDAKTGRLTGNTGDSEDDFLAEIAAWTTKNRRGDAYMLPAGSWRAQAAAYEALFTGMTVDEIDDWFAAYCSDENGRPLRPDAGSDADKAKYAQLSGEAQEMLADLTTSATISLRDPHGDLLTAIRRAWEDAVSGENLQ